MPAGENRLEPLGPPPKYDPRLLGTWQSDRRRTFRNYRFKASAKPAAVRRFKALFGKLMVRSDRRLLHASLDGYDSSGPYEVLAADDYGVVVRLKDALSQRPRVLQVTFDGPDRYWIPVSHNPWMHECFRRVTTE